MQSDPVKSVSLTGLLGMGGHVEGAKANKGAAEGGAFTAEVKKLLEAAAAGDAASTAAAADRAAKSTPQDADLDAIDLEELFLRAKLEKGGDGADDEDMASEIDALPQEEKLRMGNDLLSRALKQIAAILGLPDDDDAPAAFEFDPANIEQLAAIMAYLDLTIKMANDRIDVSANAESANIAMAAYGMESPIAHIEPEQNPAELSDFAAALRTEKFRMDMAFRLIGVSGMIAEKITENSSVAGTATGIPQAVNPADLSMSVADAVSAFSSLIREELAASVDRVRQIVRGQAEMTDLERAAVELGTVKSEILKAAINKANQAGGAQSVKIDTGVKAGVDDTDVNTDVNNTNAKANVSTDAKVDNKTGADIGVNKGIDTDAKINVNTANVRGGVVNTGADTTDKVNVKSTTPPASRAPLRGGELKPAAVNGEADVDTDVNNADKADVETGVDKTINTTNHTNRHEREDANIGVNTTVKGDVEAGVNKTINTTNHTNRHEREDANIGVNTTVKADVKGNVGTDVNTAVKADVEADVEAGVDKTINTANHTNRHERKDVNVGVNTTVKADVKGDVDTGVNAAVKTGVNTTVKADVNATVKADVKADVDTDVNAAVKADVDSGVDKTINTANRADRHERKDADADVNTTAKTEAKADADANVKTANVKADVNTANVNTANVKTDVNTADVKTDVNTANVKTDVNTTINTDVDADAAGKTAKRADADLPISARESAGRKRRSSVESANRLASKSAERAAGAAKASSSGDSAELPLSVMSLAHGKKAAKQVDGEAKKAVAEPQAQTQPQTKNTVADGETAALPTSVMESTDKKQTAKKPNGNPAAKSAKEAAKAASSAVDAAIEAAKTDKAAANKAADDAFVAKLRQAVEAGSLLKQKSGKTSGESAAKAASNDKSGAPSNSALSSNNQPNNIESNADADLSVDNGDESGAGGAGSVNSASSRSTAAARHADKADAPAVSQDDRFEVIRQISEKLNNAVRSGANEIRMVLRPESLGEMRMSIRVQGDLVFARMQVENKQVKAIVESNLQSLKDSLNRQNLEFGAIDVEVGAESEGGKSPRELWQEMEDRAEQRGFRQAVGVGVDGSPIDGSSDGFVSLGSDTGRRFGENTFEYFA